MNARTLFFWLFVLAALGLGVYGYFHLKNNKKPQVNAISFLPDSCLVYLNSNDFFGLNKKINSQSLIADKLKAFEEIQTLFSTVNEVDSIIKANDILKDEIADMSVHFALYKHRQWLAAFNIRELGQQNEIEGELIKAFRASAEKTHTFYVGPKKQLHFLLNNGTVLVSNSHPLLERALKNGAKFAESKAYHEFKNVISDNNLPAIFIHHSLYGLDEASKQLNLAAGIKTGLSAGQIDIQPSQLSINGFIRVDTGSAYVKLLQQNPCERDRLLSVLPYQITYVKAYGTDTFSVLLNKVANNDNFWLNAEEKALYPIRKDFYNNIRSFASEFRNINGETFLCLEVADTLKAIEQLKFMSDTIVAGYNGKMYELSADSIALKLFEGLFQASTNCATLLHSQLYLARDKNSLQRLMYDLSNQRNSFEDESFASYSQQHIPEEFSYLVYFSPVKEQKEISRFFNFSLKSKEEPFRDFKHYSFCMTSDEHRFKYRLHLLHETETVQREKNLLWTLHLDTTSHMTPVRFTNHNTGENEIVIQDDNNTIYLINAKGSVLWKKKISEKIQSPIYLVDVYKKEKIQMLFNTKHQLHIIDRNGQYVYGFPVRLPAEASAPLSVFDYDNDKEYRLLIPCKNNLIYNFSAAGTKLEKFTPVKTDHEVNLPVQYVKMSESQYLVTVDNEGKIYTFSRKGVGRIGLRNRTIAECKAFYIDASNSVNSTFLVYVDDKSAILNKIAFSDVKSIVRLNTETENAAVAFGQVDDNRSTDLILSGENYIKSFSFSGNLIFEKETPFKISSAQFFSDESKAFFYGYGAEAGQLYIYDQNRQAEKTFGATAMPLVTDLFRDNKIYLVMPNGKQVNCVMME